MSKLVRRGKMVHISYTDQWGIRHRESLGVQVDEKGRFPKEASDIKRRIDAEIAFGVRNYKAVQKSILLSELLKEFTAFVGCTRKDGTKYLYQLAINTMISRLGDIPLQALTEEKFITFREWIVRKQGIQNASRCIRSLSPVISYAVHKEYLPNSPINKYTRVSAPPVKPVVFTDKELATFFTYLTEKKMFHALAQLKFLLYTGFRLNESCTITWDDIDFDRRTIWHFDEKEDAYVSYPMDEDLNDLLKSIQHEKGPFVFHYRSKHSIDSIMRIAKIDLKKEGKQFNPKLKIHSLKKNYVRSLIEAKLPEMDVHKLSHHKSIQTTHKYYATFDIDNLRDSLKKSRKKHVA
jgi:integrase